MDAERKQNLRIQALTIAAQENYAHARAHEHLRGQITSILVAAAFLLIGVSIDKLAGPFEQRGQFTQCATWAWLPFSQFSTR